MKNKNGKTEFLGRMLVNCTYIVIVLWVSACLSSSINQMLHSGEFALDMLYKLVHCREGKSGLEGASLFPHCSPVMYQTQSYTGVPGCCQGWQAKGLCPGCATSPWRSQAQRGLCLGCAEMGPGWNGRQTHHSLLTPLPSSFPSFSLLSIAPYGMEYHFGYLGSALLALCPSCAPPAPLLLGGGSNGEGLASRCSAVTKPSLCYSLFHVQSKSWPLPSYWEKNQLYPSPNQHSTTKHRRETLFSYCAFCPFTSPPPESQML